MQHKDCVSIKRCRLCVSYKLKKVLDLGMSPLANSYSKNIIKNVKKYPLELNLCKNCGHLQLGHSINPRLMFTNYLYQTNTSKKNYLHFKNYAKKIFQLKKKKFKILDIASNDGTFLSFFKKKNFCLGIDPAKNLKKIAEKKGISQIVDFFTYKKSVNIKNVFGSFDIITANHVCAHVNNLNDFFSGVKNLLKNDGFFVFEVSYRGSVLKKNTFDTIYHEHMDYHALKPIENFSKKFNFQIFDFEITEAQGGSIRVFLTNSDNSVPRKKLKKIKKFIDKEKKINKLFCIKKYLDFKKKINIASSKLNKIILKLRKKNLVIAGYGAAAKTTTFLNYFGIKDEVIKFIIDDNKLKQNLYLPGRKIKIENPQRLKKTKIDILIIFAWNYSDYIIKKNKLYKKTGGKFIIPFPNPKLI
jgi:SAM-dependent methyltransferase